MIRQTWFRVALLLALGLLITGCGSGKKIVTGKVLLNGQPMTLSDKGVFVISLAPVDSKDGGEGYPAETNTDGTFKVVGRDNKGVPPGKYKVAVEAFDPYPKVDKLKGRFAPSKTTITKEIPPPNGTLTVDVGTGS